MSNIKVSVIIPVYNAEAYLRQCLDSVINQTLQEIEIICVDDGSTDQSLDILKEYEKNDSRITLLVQKNAGAGAARNKGLDIATGKYLSFLDSDDFFEPTMLEKSYCKASESQAQLIVFRASHYLQSEDKFSDISWSLHLDLLPQTSIFSANEIEKNIFRTMIGWTWDKLFRTDFIRKNNIRFQEIPLHNDLLFVFSALVSAKSIVILDEILVYQRKHPDSISTKCIAWWCVYDSLKALEQYLIKSNLYERFEQDYKNYVLHLFFHMLKRLNDGDYRHCYEKMGEWILDLKILEHDVSYFYHKNEFEKGTKIKHDYLQIKTKKNPKHSNRLFRYLQENGLGYTLNRLKSKIKNKIKR